MRLKNLWDKIKGINNPQLFTGKRGGDLGEWLPGSREDKEKIRINPEKGGSRTNKKA